MLYIIITKAQIEKCKAMGMCNCMCDNNIVRWNNDHTKMIVSMSHECGHCFPNVSMLYSYDAIQSLIKNEESWITKNIM